MKRIGLILVGGVLVIGGILLFSKKDTEKVMITEKQELENTSLVFMLQDEEGNYNKSDTLPNSGYSFNESKSICTDNATPTWEDNKLYLNNLTKRGTSCYLYFDQLCPIGAEACNTILAGRTVETRSLPFTTSTKVEGTNGKGDIYQTTDWKGTSYYFAGNPSNNWVQFGGYYWRIIRINGDGSIRMIYQGTSANTTGTSTQIGMSAFNSDYNRSESVGLKYTQNSQHGTTTKSTILTELDDWYTNTSGLTASQYSQYIDTNVGFCSDREMASGSNWSSQPSSTIYYAAYGRLVQSSNNVRPSLDCSNSSDILKIPVGLITADEVVYGGLARNDTTTNNYLYTGEYYWTMSPYSATFAYVFAVYSDGNFGNYRVNGTIGVRPVINLKADTPLTGNGTINSPFKVA